MAPTINLAAMTKPELELTLAGVITENTALRARLAAQKASEMAESAPCGPIRRLEA